MGFFTKVSAAANQQPSIAGDISNIVGYNEQSGAATITTSALNITDADNPTDLFNETNNTGASLSITGVGSEESVLISNNTTIRTAANNVIEYSSNGGASWTAIGSYTGNTAGTNLGITFNNNATLTALNDILDSNPFTYSNSSDNPVNKTLSFTYNDGTGFSTAKADVETFDITVNPINDSPTLTGNVSLGEMLVNTSDPSGVTISSAIGNRFSDVDNDSSMSGVAVVSNNADAVTEGAWQYSTDSGTTWDDVGAASTAAAVTLSSATLIRFVPVTDYSGVPDALSFHAIDDTYGGSFSDSTSSTVTANVTSNGGSTAYSDSSYTLGIQVGGNNVPVNTVPTAQTVNEDTALTFSTGNSNAISVSDADPNNTLNVTLSTSSGTLTLNTAAPEFANVSFDLGDGTDDSTVKFSGLQDDINAVLEGMTYTGSSNFNGTDSLTITTTDSADTDIDSVGITVSSVNDAPELQSELADQIFNESASVSFTLPNDAFTDPEGSNITYTATLSDDSALPAWLSFNASTLAFSGTAPDVNGDTVYEIKITASDGTASTTDTFNLTLDNLNNAPAIDANQSFNVAEATANSGAVGTVSISDADTGDSYNYTITGGTGSAIFAINSATGAITVSDNSSLDYETTNSYTLNISVNDGEDSDSDTVTINVTDSNEMPSISAQTMTVNENAANTAAVGTVNTASDVDAGDTLTYSITAGNGSGIFAINSSTGAITITDNSSLGYETANSHDLTVQVTDSGALTNSATITVNVNNVNDAPTVDANQSFTIDENAANTAAVGTVTSTDNEADTVSYAITAGNTSGVFAINSATGAITVANAPGMDYETTNSYTLTIQASDANGSTTGNVTIDVNDNNDTPSISAQSFTVNENTANTGAVGTVTTASDVDTGDTLAYSITAGNTNSVFAINSSTGVITVANAPGLDYETTTSYNLTVQVQDDGTGTLTNTATITIDVNDLNDETPSIGIQTLTIDENASNSDSVGTVTTASDTDAGDTLAYSITAGNTNTAFAINSSTGEITVANASALDYDTVQSYSLTVQVADAANNTNTATITVDINDINVAPIVANQTFTVGEDAVNTGAVGTVAASDQDDGDTLTYSITAGNGAGVFAINSSTGAITIDDNTALDYEGTASYSLTVQVQDDGAGTLSDTATITIDINDVNEDPSIGIQTLTIGEDAANSDSVGTVTTASDVDAGDTLSYSITAGNTNTAFAINSSTGEITVANMSALDYETTPSYSLTVQVEDSASNTNSATITVDINDVNEEPVLTIQDSTVSASASGSYTFDAANSSLVSISDGDSGDTITVTLDAYAGTIDVADASGATVTGDTTASVSISGTLAQVNAELDGMVYTSAGAIDDYIIINADDGSTNKSGYVEITVGNDDAVQTVDLSSSSLNLAGYEEGTIAVVSGINASQIDSVTQSGSTVITYGANNLTLAGYTSALDGTQVQFADGTVLKTATSAATLVGSNMSAGSVGDYLSGSGSADILRGLGGLDQLHGGGGNDVLFGGDGVDLLNGEAGDDLLIGEAGGDVFHFDASANEGDDYIIGFVNGSDAFQIENGTDFATDVTVTDMGSDTKISLSGGTDIFLFGVNHTDIETTDFTFI